MDKLMIPPNPNWFMQSIFCCTPDNGLLYGGMTKVVYIPPKTETGSSQAIRCIDLKNKLCGLSISPDWNDSKRFAVINSDLSVLIYDFTSGEAIKGHKGHEVQGQHQMSNQNPHRAIVYLKRNLVLSSASSNVIRYCLNTNTTKIFLDLSTRNPISMMKQSPKDNNIVAAGTRNGLILLLAVDKMEVTARLRGHDTEISSLDWMYLSMRPGVPKEDVSKVSLKNLIDATDSSDVFDIYGDIPGPEQEFGVYGETAEDGSDDEETNDAEINEKVHSNSNFNFLEACNSLKVDILAEDGEKGGSSKGTFEDNKDQYGINSKDNPSVDGSLESNASSRTPVLTEESLNYLEECQRMKDFVIVTKEEATQVEDISQVDDIPVLASGSREQIAFLWDVNERTAFCKIKWHPKPRPALPTPFTNVLWIDQSTLLVTDGNGDITEYSISLDVNTRVITSKEQKDKKFDAKGVLNLCKSEDGTVMWTSSIHRHISCLNIQKDFEKIVSLDTTQLRVHYIVESPIDSNVIAIGGNDKRICLWNTSEASHHTVSLRPFMNKIHSGVLCLSWHPERDNMLAFSTREGRIGVLDVNKALNVPTVLAYFSSVEVYSIAWAKLHDSHILIACNSHKLVYYSQKDQWKLQNVDHLKNSASVAVNGSIMAIGTASGEFLIVDIARNFHELFRKRICRKYIGMMTWHKDTLAICSDTGVTMIKNIDSNTSELSDSDCVKLDGHKGRIFSIRFNKSGSSFVSCCGRGFVKVWDFESLTVVASICINTPAYSAIFLPSNEDFIVCGGQDSTVLIFEWRKYPVDAEEATKKKSQPNKSIQWAATTEVTTISKNSQKRQKKKVLVVAEESVSELSTGVVKMNLQTKKVSTIFHHAAREITSNPLEFIEMLLSSKKRELSFNEKLFGDHESVKQIIATELEQSKNLTPGSVFLPQLNDTLKQDIQEHIESKTLTELHVAVSPSVSFDLWRKCCIAYGTQCIENEDSLAAVPYFLAVNDIDTCINQLCDGKYFREAFVIAKMRRDDSDPVFDTIIRKWVANYDYSGNYESAAALLACKQDYKKASEILEKRQNKSEICSRVVDLLATKTA